MTLYKVNNEQAYNGLIVMLSSAGFKWAEALNQKDFPPYTDNIGGVKIYRGSNSYDVCSKGFMIGVPSEKYEFGMKLGFLNDSKQEELTDTNRYKTNSGKQLFEVLHDDLLSYEEYRGFLKANIYKYVQRYKQKNGIQDLKKAQVYLEELIKLEDD